MHMVLIWNRCSVSPVCGQNSLSSVRRVSIQTCSIGMTGRWSGMDPITLIVTALATGASAGGLEVLKDDVRDAVKAAYVKLRRLAQIRFAGRPDGEMALERHEAAPQKWESVLTGELTEGKSVIIGDPNRLKTKRLLHSYGRFINRIGTT